MAFGLAAGILLSLACGPFLRSYLYGLSPIDPTASGMVLALLGLAAALATFVPPRRACSVDPAVTLRGGLRGSRSVSAGDAVLTDRRASLMALTARLTVLLFAALGTTGCLQKETSHTLYLSPDGSVRWTVEESGVFSDERDAGQRLAEERAYIGPALIGAHPAALGLQALSPDGLVRTVVIRDERPFHVVTDARFYRVDRMFERLFKEAGLKTAVTVEEDDGRHCLRMRLDFSGKLQQRDSPATALLEDFETFRFVLAEGRFIAGGGFDVPDRHRAVISREWIDAASRAVSEKREIELVLTWTGIE